MTLFLRGEDVVALATDELVMGAARAAVAAERDGRTILPARLDLDHRSGFLRVMPAAVDGLVGLKVMTLAKGLGTRYLVLLYDAASGELLAMVDADEITRLRTAATTALAGSLLAPGATTALALIGSGFEAEGHLRLFASVWPLERVLVYSRSPTRRAAFAARMAGELGIDVRPAGSMEEAVAGASVSVLATKSSEPVVEGRAFPAGAVVLSVGSTRPDLRELDRESLRRAVVLLVDDVAAVCAESGDIIDALETQALPRERIVAMSALAETPVPDGDRDLRVFKSVGTAVHDIALAAAVIARARERGVGRDLGEITRLKPFAELVLDAPAGVPSTT